MITAEKFKIFDKYKGDPDGYARTGTNNEKKILNCSDWFVIEDMISDINLIDTQITSSVFNDKVQFKLIANFDHSAIEYLHKYAAKKKD